MSIEFFSEWFEENLNLTLREMLKTQEGITKNGKINIENLQVRAMIYKFQYEYEMTGLEADNDFDELQKDPVPHFRTRLENLKFSEEMKEMDELRNAILADQQLTTILANATILGPEQAAIIRMLESQQDVAEQAVQDLTLLDMNKMTEVFRDTWDKMNMVNTTVEYFLGKFSTYLEKLPFGNTNMDNLRNEILKNTKFMKNLALSVILYNSGDNVKEIENVNEQVKQYVSHDKSKHLLDIRQSKTSWRFLVDGIKQRDGETPTKYDKREEGCLVAMAKGLREALEHLDEEITFDHIINIHNLCVKDVKKLQPSVYSEQYRMTNLVEFGVRFSNDDYNLTQAGVRELLLHEGQGRDYYYNQNRIGGILKGKELEERIEQILSTYNKEMKNLLDPAKKLSCIVSMISHLERVHPFYDANCRTLCVIVLNRELIKHGFPPVILDDPNRFDGSSTHESMQDVINGFKNFEHVKKDGFLSGEKLGELTKEDEILIGEINKEMSQPPKQVKGNKIPKLLTTQYNLSSRPSTSASTTTWSEIVKELNAMTPESLLAKTAHQQIKEFLSKQPVISERSAEHALQALVGKMTALKTSMNFKDPEFNKNFESILQNAKNHVPKVAAPILKSKGNKKVK